jgi:hypothetical protein
MTTVVLIHGGQSTAEKLKQALPGSEVVVIYRQGLSEVYNETTGLASEYPTLRSLMAQYAPGWSPGEPLVMLGFSAGAWALRYYLRDGQARSDITAAIFLDGLYGASGGNCNLAPYDGVLSFAEDAQLHPSKKRLVMTYSKAHPAPELCSKAIAAAVGGGSGPGVFVIGANNADHGAQQGVMGPMVVRDLIAPWLRSSPSTLLRVALVVGAGAAAWFLTMRFG